MTTCKSCELEIVWGRTERGKGIPLDPKPSKAGELIFVKTASTGEVIVRPITNRDKNTTQDKYVNHQSTCTNVNEWRHSRNG